MGPIESVNKIRWDLGIDTLYLKSLEDLEAAVITSTTMGFYDDRILPYIIDRRCAQRRSRTSAVDVSSR